MSPVQPRGLSPAEPWPVVATSILGILLLAMLWWLAVTWARSRVQPRPGYGPSAYLGRPPGATLDVDLLGDPRYGGVTPLTVTLEELRPLVTYVVPSVDRFGAPDRIDYWADNNGSARLVWVRLQGEFSLLLWPLGGSTATIMRGNLALADGSFGSSSWTVNGAMCAYLPGDPYGDPPSLPMAH